MHFADHLVETKDGEAIAKRVEITVLIDGNPFKPRYETVYAHHALTTERAKELAYELFGSRHTTVCEIMTHQRRL